MRFLPHVPQAGYTAGALVAALYLVSGVRGMERGTISMDRDAQGNDVFSDVELCRMAVPRRVYSVSHMDYVVDRLAWLLEHRDLVGGLEFVRGTARAAVLHRQAQGPEGLGRQVGRRLRGRLRSEQLAQSCSGRFAGVLARRAKFETGIAAKERIEGKDTHFLCALCVPSRLKIASPTAIALEEPSPRAPSAGLLTFRAARPRITRSKGFAMGPAGRPLRGHGMLPTPAEPRGLPIGPQTKRAFRFLRGEEARYENLRNHSAQSRRR